MELVAIIIVMGIAVSTLMSFLSETTRRVRFSENEVSAAFSAEQVMESVITQGYSNISNYSRFSQFLPGWDNYSNVTTNVTEYRQKTANASDGFTKSVVVRYCNVSVNQWNTTDNAADLYKMVNVTVSKSGSKAVLFTIF